MYINCKVNLRMSLASASLTERNFKQRNYQGLSYRKAKIVKQVVKLEKKNEACKKEGSSSVAKERR